MADTKISDLTTKAAPYVDADKIAGTDSEDSDASKNFTIANIKSTLNTGATLDNVAYLDQANTFTNDIPVTLESATSARPVLNIINTNADANGPILKLFKNSASPADDDELGVIRFSGDDSGGTETTYITIAGYSSDITDNDEGAELDIKLRLDGTQYSMLNINGYNGSVGEGEVIFNESGNDVDFRIESDNDVNAFFLKGSDGNIGLGTNAPDGSLHVFSGSAGTVSASAGADEIVIENNGNVGMTFLCPDANNCNLYFGSESDNLGALVRWDYDADLMQIGTNKAGANIRIDTGGGSEALRIDNLGNIGVGVTAFGTNGTNVIGITADGTVPADNPAGMIQIYADDSSDGATNATLAIRTEQAVEAIGTFTASHKLKIWINGTEYWIQLDAV